MHSSLQNTPPFMVADAEIQRALDNLAYAPAQVYAPKPSGKIIMLTSGLFRYKTKQTIPLTEYGNLVVGIY